MKEHVRLRNDVSYAQECFMNVYGRVKSITSRQHELNTSRIHRIRIWTAARHTGNSGRQASSLGPELQFEQML